MLTDLLAILSQSVSVCLSLSQCRSLSVPLRVSLSMPLTGQLVHDSVYPGDDGGAEIGQGQEEEPGAHAG